MGELFGTYNGATGEWNDGIAAKILREFAEMET